MLKISFVERTMRKYGSRNIEEILFGSSGKNEFSSLCRREKRTSDEIRIENIKKYPNNERVEKERSRFYYNRRGRRAMFYCCVSRRATLVPSNNGNKGINDIPKLAEKRSLLITANIYPLLIAGNISCFPAPMPCSCALCARRI